MTLAQRTATTATRTMPRLETATETDIESQPTRIEHDCIGSAAVPANVYWGIHTLRAINNFPVSGITVSDHPEIIHAYGAVKLACTRANRELAARHLATITGLPIRPAADPVGATSDVSDFVMLSSVIKRTALHLGKIANDLRLLASGPRAGLAEIQLPPRQAGSSIMPGKMNPVIPECVNQTVFMVMGMDTTVSYAAQAGQLQLNTFEPVMLHAMLDGMRMLARAMDTLRERCVNGIKVNKEVGMAEAMRSSSLATSLIDYVGYEKAVQIAKDALAKNTTVRAAADKEGSIRPEILDSILDPRDLTRVY